MTHSQTITAPPVTSLLPPLVPGYRFVGVAPQMMRAPLQFLVATASASEGVVRLPLLRSQSLYLLHHPDHVKYVMLDNNRNFSKGAKNRVFELVAGEGLFTS